MARSPLMNGLDFGRAARKKKKKKQKKNATRDFAWATKGQETTTSCLNLPEVGKGGWGGGVDRLGS